jgi:hypothetical protein
MMEVVRTFETSNSTRLHGAISHKAVIFIEPSLLLNNSGPKTDEVTGEWRK